MALSDIFKRKKEQPTKSEAPSHWLKCGGCNSLMYYKEVENQQYVCPKCGYHIRIDANKRIKFLVDENSFVEHDQELKPVDPISFVDKKSYKKRLEDAKQKTGRNSSVVSGSAKIFDFDVELVVFDFSFMGGSLASVEGEKIYRAVNRAIEKKSALIIVSASGGARMQESTFSLMQMAKTSTALGKLSDHKLPFISILTDPTMGGVSASFANLGDLIIAEPGALIGFAGQRVIKQTIGSDLPDGFQTAEFLLEHGSIDMVVKRNELRDTIKHFLQVFKLDREDDEIVENLYNDIEEEFLEKIKRGEDPFDNEFKQNFLKVASKSHQFENMLSNEDVDSGLFAPENSVETEESTKAEQIPETKHSQEEYKLSIDKKDESNIKE